MFIENFSESPEENDEPRVIHGPGENRYHRKSDPAEFKYGYLGKFAVLGMCSGIDVLHMMQDKFEPGGTYTAPSTRFVFSRDGAGVAKAMRDIGLNAGFFGFSGGDGGKLLRTKLDSEDIEYTLSKVQDNTCMGSIIVDDSGVETQLSSTSFYVTMREYMNLTKELAKKPYPDHLVISGPVPHMTDNFVYKDIIRYFQERGTKIFLDCTGAPHRLAIKQKPDFIMVTKKTLEERYDCSVQTLAEVLLNIRRYRNDTGCEVIVDAGDDGFVYYGKKTFATAIPARYYTGEKVKSKINEAENIDFERVNPTRRHCQFIASFLWAYEYTCGNSAEALKIGAAMSRAVLDCKYDDEKVSVENRRYAVERTVLKVYEVMDV